MVKEAMVIDVVTKTGALSRNRKINETLASTAKNIEKPSPTWRRTGFGRDSTTVFPLVRIYQSSVRPGISSRMEKGIISPEMIGRVR